MLLIDKLGFVIFLKSNLKFKNKYFYMKRTFYGGNSAPSSGSSCSVPAALSVFGCVFRTLVSVHLALKTRSEQILNTAADFD